jgi:cytochrome c556
MIVPPCVAAPGSLSGGAAEVQQTVREGFRMTRKLALTAAVLLVVGGTAWADGIDPIMVRQTGMDLVTGTAGGIKAVLAANGDVKTLEAAGKAIKRWSTVFPSLFVVGSDKGDTKAAPAIWSDQAGFQKAAMALGTAADALTAAAKAGDAAATAAAFKDVGAACGACHKDYRLK